MRQIYADLWQTETEHPFTGVRSNAYLLTRARGNVLFYGTGAHHELAQIAQLGGMLRHYLSHRHEAGYLLNTIREKFGSALCCHEKEADTVSQFCPVDLRFDRAQTHLENIQIIPSPGHTSGSTCFLYDSPHGKRYLFTGDTISPTEDGWASLVFPADGGNRSALRMSLELLETLAPDVIIASAHQAPSAVTEVTAAEWRNITERVSKNL